VDGLTSALECRVVSWTDVQWDTSSTSGHHQHKAGHYVCRVMWCSEHHLLSPSKMVSFKIPTHTNTSEDKRDSANGAGYEEYYLELWNCTPSKKMEVVDRSIGFSGALPEGCVARVPLPIPDAAHRVPNIEAIVTRLYPLPGFSIVRVLQYRITLTPPI
jgi:hypothetical protein